MNASSHEMLKPICISAVIPTYNREQTIARAVDSVFAQEFPASEVIIIDDGSTDNTRVIVETYGEKVRYFFQSNEGVSAARNRGVHEAKGQWIAFLDSDDYWLPHHLRHMSKAIELTEGRAALYFCDIRRPADEGGRRHWDLCEFKINGPFEFRHDATEWAFMGIQPMFVQASVIGRESYLGVGGLPEDLRIREDTLLFFKLCLLSPACAVSGVGTVMTSDGDMRLTQELGSASMAYSLATVSVYREALALGNRISREKREILIDALSAAHFGVARLFCQEKKYLSSARKLFDSASLRPSRFTKELMGSIGRKARGWQGRFQQA